VRPSRGIGRATWFRSIDEGRTYTRQQGELLHPNHEPADVLIELKRKMGPIAFSAQYQRSPIPPGGTIIRSKWLTIYDDVQYQSGDRLVMSWDIALSETETGDYSALCRPADSRRGLLCS
jgi:hypothetical protein